MTDPNHVSWGSLRQKAEDATKPAPPGDYTVEVKSAVVKAASTSGNPMIVVTGKITEGPYAGKTVFNNFNITYDNDFALAIFFRHMAAFGLGAAFFDSLAPGDIEPVAQALVGRSARWTLSIRQWQGQDRNQVDAIAPLGGPGAAGPVPPVPGGSPASVPTPNVGPPLPVAAPPGPSTPPSLPTPAPTEATVPPAPPPLPF